MARAYVGLGSNVGDRHAAIEQAVTRLSALPETYVHARSRTHEYAAVGGPPQGPYLNAVVELVTTLAPDALLAALLTLEQALGRQRPDAVRWGPRPIDLDLLLYDERIASDPTLTLPHPRLHERRFALEPLVEIAPHAYHPVKQQTALELLDRLRAEAVR